MNDRKKILVTGPRGLLGATLLRTLTERGYDAAGFEGDIKNKDALMQAADAFKPLWIVHTAAKVDVGACERDPKEAFAVNAGGTQNVVDAARAADASLIYISTASVFSGHEGDYKEEDTPEPNNVYNKTKVEGEAAVLAYEKGMVLRLNIVGIHPKGSRGKNFMEFLVDSFNENKNVNLFTDQLINPLSNWTIAKMIGQLIAKNASEKILHIGSSDVLSKAGIGMRVVTYFPNYTGTITTASVDTIADGVARPKQMWLNTARAQSLLGPMPALSDEVESILTKAKNRLK